MLKRVEGDNADRIVKLSRYQIGDDGFEVCPLNFGLPVDGAICAEAIDDEVSDNGWSGQSLTTGREAPPS
jgi:hypothetical protein